MSKKNDPKDLPPDPRSKTMVQGLTSVSPAKLDKYRKMIKAGLPKEAIAIRAQLEGFHMDVILDAISEQTAVSKRYRESILSVSPRSIKKYKRMLENGICLAAVQQMAHVENGLEPDQFLEACEMEQSDQLQYAMPTRSPIGVKFRKDPMIKYRNMVKCGIPVLAVQQTALRDGIDPEIVVREIVDIDPEAQEVFFTPVNDNEHVEFPRDSGLCKVVARMMQTVQRRATRINGQQTKTTLRLSKENLYNALGSLQGFQWAVEQYNFTTNMKGSFREAKARRQAYVEMASTLGLKVPVSYRERVSVPGLSELIEHVRSVYQEELKEIQHNCEALGLYNFESLAFLYMPGTKVVAKNAGGGGVDMICQVVWNRYEQGRVISGQETRYFQVCLEYIAAVGADNFVMVEVVEGIGAFDGNRSIKSTMNFVPLAAYSKDEQAALLSHYHKRGQVYNRVATGKPTYMEYEKNSFFIKRGGLAQGASQDFSSAAGAMATGGRIMVDTQGAYDHGHTIGVGYDPMVLAIKHKYKEYRSQLRSMKNDDANSPHDDGGAGMALLDAIPDDWMVLTWPSVVGFSFSNKRWGDVLVDSLSEVEFQDGIFDRLVLPANRKRIVKALIRHGNDDEFQDVIPGKGEGSVFLLYGPPGVGKTLTAEAVCEMLHKPLYSVSLGQLGITPADLEANLGKILQLCSKWNALILLDEADIFLEKRTSQGSLERNAMVSVMLRLVEYFQGILFMTSNRVDSLDPAFQTRITLALRYDNLDRPGRAQIWKNLLEKSGYVVGENGAAFNAHKLAKAQLNGREIKNCIRMGLAMAAEDSEPLSEHLLLETIETIRELSDQMKSSKSYDQDPNEEGKGKKKKTFLSKFGLFSSAPKE